MASLKQEIEEARLTHSIQSVLGTNKRKIVCPLPTHIHHSNTPSFSIFWHHGVQLFRCHGNCGLQGDVIDLVGYLRVNGYDPRNPKKVKEALALLDSRYDYDIPTPEPEIKLAADEWELYMPPDIEVIEYAKTRGLTIKTLEKFRVGQSGKYMTLPCFENHRLIGIKLRNTTNIGMRFFSLEGSHQGMFNFDAVNMTTEPVFMVKGEIPCMLLDQLGFLACAPASGEQGWKDSWRIALALSRVIVVGDNDDTGIKAAQKRARLVNGLLKFPPAQYKDIDEWILSDRDAVHELEKWREEAKNND